MSSEPDLERVAEPFVQLPSEDVLIGPELHLNLFEVDPVTLQPMAIVADERDHLPIDVVDVPSAPSSAHGRSFTTSRPQITVAMGGRHGVTVGTASRTRERCLPRMDTSLSRVGR